MNIRKLFLIACGVFGACRAQAAVITFDALPATIGNGTYNGFIASTVDGVFENLVCNDFDHFTEAPSGPWDYNVSTLFTLTFARFGNDAAGIARYQQAALLLAGDGDTLVGLAGATTADDITAYQYALWALFASDVDPVNNSDVLVLTALNDLSNGKDYGAIYSELRVYTPVASDADNQEFLGLATSASTSVPEPASVLLVGMGLLAGMWVRKTR